MFKSVSNTNEVSSSSDSTPSLNNTSSTSIAKMQTEPKLNCIFEWKTVI